MKIDLDPRIDKTVRSLSEADSSRVVSLIDLFKKYGFTLSTVYLKKLAGNIWELRAGRFRLLFGFVGGKAIIVNMFSKKTQKTPRHEIELAQRRLGEYI